MSSRANPKRSSFRQMRPIPTVEPRRYGSDSINGIYRSIEHIGMAMGQSTASDGVEVLDLSEDLCLDYVDNDSRGGDGIGYGSSIGTSSNMNRDAIDVERERERDKSKSTTTSKPPTSSQSPIGSGSGSAIQTHSNTVNINRNRGPSHSKYRKDSSPAKNKNAGDGSERWDRERLYSSGLENPLDEGALFVSPQSRAREITSWNFLGHIHPIYRQGILPPKLDLHIISGKDGRKVLQLAIPKLVQEQVGRDSDEFDADSDDNEREKGIEIVDPLPLPPHSEGGSGSNGDGDKHVSVNVNVHNNYSGDGDVGVGEQRADDDQLQVRSGSLQREREGNDGGGEGNGNGNVASDGDEQRVEVKTRTHRHDRQGEGEGELVYLCARMKTNGEICRLSTDPHNLSKRGNSAYVGKISSVISSEQSKQVYTVYSRDRSQLLTITLEHDSSSKLRSMRVVILPSSGTTNLYEPTRGGLVLVGAVQHFMQPLLSLKVLESKRTVLSLYQESELTVTMTERGSGSMRIPIIGDKNSILVHFDYPLTAFIAFCVATVVNYGRLQPTSQ